MVELFAAVTGVELGKLVLEQVLNLGKSALEDYVKDFFKDCLGSAVARANAETLKKPMAEAIGCFIQQFIAELQFHNVHDTSIDHHYKAAIKRFVRDKSVRSILGKAFEKDCKQIDYNQLEQIWTQQYQVDGWRFPAEEFDWRGVAREYVKGAKSIIKANAELRSLLNTELLEDIAHNTAQLSPGFDVDKYRESLQCSYGYLKLYTLDSTDRADMIKLWSMFIEQTVREALPPTRYELPLDLKRQLQEQEQLEDLSPEALERYRREYLQQPARKVLQAVAKANYAVVLGDPGSGKSTLLQYLALDWVEGKTETLPLLIELHDYVLAQSKNFLDFLHRGRGANWQFDERQLDQYLSDNPSLVMFDGLDEVFDRPTQAAVVDDIIRFAQQYPQAKVLVTSRIIGYNPERFQHAGFRQFTIQPLHEDEVYEFIDRWYDLAMGSDSDKVQLKQRLKDAIANSKAIANLADSPLLLTMMAILNRRQELPRDRADLYDQASRVLLYHWDVDHKRLQLPVDAIGRREKQEMLRLIAYEMQAGEGGLKGNLIGVGQLTRILTDYLRDQGFNESREKANQLIQQLRERNFILCYRGADSYGFVHRTFLEYFCALEIVNRFEKQRTLTFEQLRDEIFGHHWQDQAWHEVLRLICGAIDARFSGLLIRFLTEQEIDRTSFLEEVRWMSFDNEFRSCLRKEGLSNLLLATECLTEIQNRSTISEIDEALLKSLQNELRDEGLKTCSHSNEISNYSLTHEAANGVLQAIANTWKDDSQVLFWLRDNLLSREESYVPTAAIQAMVRSWKDNPETLDTLYKIINQLIPSNSAVEQVSVYEIARCWNNYPNTLALIKNLAKNHNSPNLQQAALKELSRRWKEDDNTLNLLKLCAQSENCFFGVRSEAITEIADGWANELWVFEFLCNRAINDPFVRAHKSNRNPRLRAMNALLVHYPTYPKTIELLHDRALNDPDEQLREWAQQQLEKLGKS